MRISILYILLVFLACKSSAQTMQSDTLPSGNVIVMGDVRISRLGNEMAQYYDGLSRKSSLVSGYRLMLMNTTDRNRILDLRTRLLQIYPDQKLYTIFQAPYIKLKFGNYLDKEEADKMKKEILSLGLVSENIYVVPDKIEFKADKPTENTMPAN